MKKLILSLLAFTIVLASYAHENLFERNRTQRLTREKMIPISPNLLKHNSTNVNVPTYVKKNNWDNINNTWQQLSAVKSTYNGSKLMSELFFSNNFIDTNSKTDYTYDVNGRYSLIENKIYNLISHTFVNGSRISFSYFANGSYSYLEEFYDNGKSAWVPYSRRSQVYDTYGSEIKFTIEQYTNGKWKVNLANAKNITYYNNTNKIFIKIDSTYNFNTQKMVADKKQERTYNSNNEITTISYYTFTIGQPEIFAYDSVFYDLNGMISDLTYYDVATMAPTYKYENIKWAGNFNPNIDVFDNQIDSYTVKMYFNNIWVTISRYSTLYPDNFGSRISLTEIMQNNKIIPFDRSSFINDSHLNLIEDSEESYDTTSGWIIMSGNKNILQYDANNILERIEQYYNFQTLTYVNSTKFEYSNFINITQGFSTSKNTLEAKLFPNPSTNGSANINLKLEEASNITIELSDLNGRIISTENLFREKGLNTIKLDGLSKGMFVVSVKTETGVFRTKLLVTSDF